MIDEENISISTGAILSALTDEEQLNLLDYLTTNKVKITVNHGEQLKILSQKKKLTPTSLADILEGNKTTKKGTSTNTVIKVNRKNIQSYFKENETETTIENTILEALKYYFERKEKED